MTDLHAPNAPAVPPEVEQSDLALSTAPVIKPDDEPSNGPRSLGLREISTTIRRGWRRLTSMRTALLLLALLALAAIPGSLIPQTNVDPQSVTDYVNAHPKLGPLAQHLGLFDVFASPWFAAIYLLLFVSLIGCLGPRIKLHAKALRRRPPKAPRRLSALSTSTEWHSEDSPDAVVEGARRMLSRKRWRTDVTQEADGAVSVAAEKGYLRETGNLVFHLALLLMLVGVALSSFFGYKGQKLVIQGQGFSDSPVSYNSFTPPRDGNVTLPPFSFHLNKFTATYTDGNTPSSFDAQVSYKSSPTAAAVPFDIRVNHPISVDGDHVYLINDGYAVRLTITGANGKPTKYTTPFLSDTGTTDIANSHGVVKDPDVGGGQQLGLQAELFSDFSVATGTSISSTDANPVLTLVAYKGNLGLNSGVPQNDFSLAPAGLKKDGQKRFLKPGQTWRLPSGETVRFDGVTPYAVFQVAHSPGNWPLLIAAVLIVAGITTSLRVRRRRVWLRAAPAGSASGASHSVVTAAGLTRSDPDGFAREFAAIVSQCGGPAVPADGSEE